MPESTEFLPFHAINEFMRPDFRLTVIRETLNNQSTVSEFLSSDLNHKIKKYVKIPGFRNSEKAPPLVKVLPTSKAFEKNPELVSSILSCWSEYNLTLCQQILDLLKDRHWSILTDAEGITLDNLSVDLLKQWPVFPLSVNRAKLPGFYTHWPKGENFEKLYDHFIKLHPESEASMDKVSLMAVWVSMRLPYHVDEENEILDDSQSENKI